MAMAGDARRAATSFQPNVTWSGLRARESAVFFGNRLGDVCRKCGGYEQTSTGHTYCTQMSCPIAMLEIKRRKRRRTSVLETVYVPLLAAKRQEADLEPDHGVACLDGGPLPN